MKDKSRKKRNYKIAVIILIGIFLLIFAEAMVLVYNNRKKTESTALLLIENTIEAIKGGKKNAQAMMDVAKKEYIYHAKFAAHLLADSSDALKDIDEIKAIAIKADVDEINIFDSKGNIIFGTVEAYYGMNMDSGEQMRFFKPMLGDKELVMCQEPTLNTADRKIMQYAMCWSVDGSYLVQIGMNQARIDEILKICDIKNVMNNMPAYSGVAVIVTDFEDGKILGTTEADNEAQTLEETGVSLKFSEFTSNISGITKYNNKNFYYTTKVFDEYGIVVLQSFGATNKDIVPMMLFMLFYLIVTAVAISHIINLMSKQVVKESEKANKDRMTGVYNRFAYENFLDENPGVPADCNFVYAALDLNGLKTANDTLGHEAGDEMIKSAAECMRTCFGEFGKLYRTGGDEFVGILSMPEDVLEEKKNEFEEKVGGWTGRRFVHMTVSAGYVRAAEFPERTIRELSKIADDRMYLAKEMHYRKKGEDRRNSRMYIEPAAIKDVTMK